MKSNSRNRKLAEEARLERFKQGVEEYRRKWPPMFPGIELDNMTMGGLKWRTLCNLRCLKRIPEDCFIAKRNPVLVLRDPILDWWIKYESTRPTIHPHPKQGKPPAPPRRPKTAAAPPPA